MKAAIRIIYILLLVAACKNSKSVSPDILPQSKMKEVLWDIARADLLVANYMVKKDSTINTKEESIKLYQQIFRIHHITKEEFEKSFSYYKSHPLLYRSLLDSVSAHSTVGSSQLAIPTNINDTSRSSTSRRDSLLKERMKRKLIKRPE